MRFSVSSIKQCGHWLFLLWGIASLSMVASGILTRPLSNDEQAYYLPVIELFSKALPQIPIADYPFPGPPLGIFLQAIGYSLSAESYIAVRAMSWLGLLALGVLTYYRVRAYLPKTQVALFALMPLSLPFFLQHGFTLRQHIFAVLFLYLGFVPLKTLQDSNISRRDYHCVFWLTLAVLIHQFVITYCVTLLICLVYSEGRFHLVVSKKKLLYAIPLFSMLCLVMLWGGLTPPSFTDKVFQHADSGFLSAIAKQAVLLCLSVGVWLAPIYGKKFSFSRKFLISFALSFALCLLSRGFSENADFYNSIIGPVSNLVRHFAMLISCGEVFVAFVLSVPIALGLSWLICDHDKKPEHKIFQIFSVAYFAMMCMVPHFFESYYMYFLVVSAFILTTEGKLCESQPRWRLVALGAVILLGFFYTNATLFFRR